MSNKTLAIAAFWLLVVLGIVWQTFFINPKAKLNEPQTFVMPTVNIPTLQQAPTPTPVPKIAYLYQTSFSAEACKDRAHFNSFKATIVVYNPSSETATDIKIRVRPYRAASEVFGDTDQDQVLDENNPISKITKWLAVPDLPPRQSATVTLYFDKQGVYAPGKNPGAVIEYQTPLLGEVGTPDTELARLAFKKATLEEMLRRANPNRP